AGREGRAGPPAAPAPGPRGRRGDPGRRLPHRAGHPDRGNESLMPALPLHEAGKYVAGAYLVFLVLLLVYVAIMSSRLARIDRELGELADLAENRSGETPPVRTREQIENAGGEVAGKVFEAGAEQ